MGFVITGLGGIGKTQLATKYFEIFSSFFGDNIVWVNADDLQSSVEDIAEALQLNIKDEFGNYISIKAIIKQVHGYFVKDNVLFIFDNADNSYKGQAIGFNNIQKEILKYLPTSLNMYTIIPSQNKFWGQQFQTMQLSPFNKNVASKFLAQGLSESAQNTVINDLVDLMDCHPFGLQQAISYIKETKTTLQSYLYLLKDQPQAVLKKSAVFGAFRVALSKITAYENNSSVVKMLNIMCYMNGKSIQKEFFIFLNFGDRFNETENILEINNAIQVLESYSLISLTPLTLNDTKKDIIAMHSLVQEAIINIREKNQSQYQTFSELMHLIRINYKNVESTIYDRKVCIDQFIHIFQSSQRHIELMINDNEYRLFVHKIESQISETGKIKKSTELLNEVKNVELRILGEEHPGYLITKSDIADRLAEIGQINESLVLLNEVKDVELRVLGEEHPSYLITKSNIADGLAEIGQINESLVLLNEVKDVQFRILGEEHRSYLITKSNIADRLAKIDQINESLVLLNEVKDVELRILGEEHPGYLITKSDIADRLAEIGQINESLVLLNEVKDVQLRILGEEHPGYLITKSNIADRLAEIGQINESLVLLNEVKDVQLRILGEEHPSYLITKHNIAVTLAEIERKKTSHCILV